ncbi:MAG TPA: SGNH/GDSL hydrolase family protein [Bacillota bacterium]|nr:SGNH/GDSL hydrolase family protein [Bacillota bacterium]
MAKKSLFLFFVCAFLFGFMACGSTQSEVTTMDMSQFPGYQNDPDLLSYDFSALNRMRPYWKGNVMYNETVLMVEDGGVISGKLLLAPQRILSVRDFSLQVEYVSGQDYEIVGNVIRLVSGSRIPYLTKANLSGQNIPSPYRLVTSISNTLTDYVMMGANVVYTESPLWYGNQLSVSYVFDLKDLDPSDYPAYDGTTLPNLMAKLEAQDPIRITAIGDSVLAGCSSSAYFNREPYMPNFMELTEEGLEEYYGNEVQLTNLSVGGTTSFWGSNPTNLVDIKESAPDVLFIHFGINDCGSGTSPNAFRDNIELMILSIREDLPGCEFVLFTAFAPNGNAYDQMRFEDYWEKLRLLESNHPGVKVIDLWSLSQTLLETKIYEDMTGNGINHVNDFSSRIYLMSILSTFVSNETMKSKEE